MLQLRSTVETELLKFENAIFNYLEPVKNVNVLVAYNFYLGNYYHYRPPIQGLETKGFLSLLVLWVRVKIC